MHRNSENSPKRRRKSIRGYEIRVASHLEDTDAEWFGAASIANQENGDALLSGAIPDQAALMSVLLRLHDLGLTILSVKALRRRR
jgi:hypothetical protein